MSRDFSEHLSKLTHTQRKLVSGALVFERDDPVKSLFRVDRGEVHLLRRQPDGASSILQRARDGELLAEASLNSASYHCAAVTVTPTQLSVYSRADVAALITHSSAAAIAYGAHLAGEVRDARLRAEVLSLRRVADRLDAWLVWNDAGLPDKGGWHHVASEIGVSPEALYRELARRR